MRIALRDINKKGVEIGDNKLTTGFTVHFADNGSVIWIICKSVGPQQGFDIIGIEV